MSIRLRRFSVAFLSSSCLFLNAAAVAAPIFDFEGTSNGTGLPLTLSNSGLSATFSGAAHVCNSGGTFSTLSGEVLIQDFCQNDGAGSVNILFSQDLSSASFDFAIAGVANDLNVTFLENGNSLGWMSFNSSVPNGRSNGEGIATLEGSTFNGLSLSVANGKTFAIDNLTTNSVSSAVPEPESVALLGIGLLAAFGTVRRRKRHAA